MKKFALTSGLALSLALATSPVLAGGRGGGGGHGGGGYHGGGYHGGGGYRGGGHYGGYRGGYGGYYGGGGIGLGGFLLGAAVIGSIAVAASANNQPVYTQSYDPYTGGYYSSSVGGYAPAGNYAPAGEYAGPPPAPYAGVAPESVAAGGPVEDCSRAAERQAQGSGGLARVTNIDRVDAIEGGANVHGVLEVNRGPTVPLQTFGFSCTAAAGQVTSLRLG